MKLRHLNESINDRAIFKAIFLAGIPGAGKSRLIQDIRNPHFGVRVIDPDKYVELRGDITDKEIDRKRATELTNAVNGMLPMYLSGTGASAPVLLRRDEMLTSFGYDTAMIWVGSDVETAITNMQARQRKVPLDHIISNFESLQEHELTYRQHFGADFHAHVNAFLTPEENEEIQTLREKDRVGELHGVDAGRLDQLEEKYQQVRHTDTNLSEIEEFSDMFFGSAIKNAKGQSVVSYLESTGGKYMTDGVISYDKLLSILAKW